MHYFVIYHPLLRSIFTVTAGQQWLSALHLLYTWLLMKFLTSHQKGTFKTGLNALYLLLLFTITGNLFTPIEMIPVCLFGRNLGKNGIP